MVSCVYLKYVMLISAFFFFSVIVKATNGPRYVVGCRRQVNHIVIIVTDVELQYGSRLTGTIIFISWRNVRNV